MLCLIIRQNKKKDETKRKALHEPRAYHEHITDYRVFQKKRKNYKKKNRVPLHSSTINGCRENRKRRTDIERERRTKEFLLALFLLLYHLLLLDSSHLHLQAASFAAGLKKIKKNKLYHSSLINQIITISHSFLISPLALSCIIIDLVILLFFNINHILCCVMLGVT